MKASMRCATSTSTSTRPVANTLNRLGDHMPKFLADGGFDRLKRRAFATDLARLELLMSEVFDAEDSPVLNEEQVAAVPPDDMGWHEAARDSCTPPS